MMMNTNDLFHFLGHASINDAFDDFLTVNGITRRPKSSDSYPYSIETKEAGLTLGFEDDPNDKGMQCKSLGQFVFCEIYFDFESKKKYSGDLPLGIGTFRASADIERVLGQPRVRKDGKQTAGFTISYFVQGSVLTAAYADKEGKVLRFVRISLKSKYHVTHGLAPA